MTSRRLLAASGWVGAFTPPVPAQPLALLSSPKGGWTVISQATAASYDGHTYIVYVNSSNGNVEIVDYDEVADTTSSAFVLHSALDSPADAHDGPAVLVRSSDHRIVVAYAQHGDTNPRVRISTNPADVSAFGSEIVPSITSDSITYCNLIELSAESAIYLFFRDHDHGTETSYWSYMKSTDDGSTWSAATRVYANPAQSAYWHVGSNGVDRIDIAATDKAPQAIGGSNASNVYHAYYLGGSWYKTDGTLISAGMPFAPADLTKVCDGAAMGGGNFPVGIAYTTDGYPVIANSLYLASGTDNSYCDLRWSGSAWAVNIIQASAGGVFFSNQSPGVSVDWGDASVYYLGLKVGSQFEMFRFETADDGATWASRQLSFDSTAPNIRPSQVVGHGDALACVWLVGTYTSDTDFSLSVRGAVA